MTFQKTKNNNNKKIIFRVFLIISFIVLFFLSILIGLANVNLKGLLLFDAKQWNVVLVSRLPRTLAVILVGASLTIAGVIIQTISRNKFVSPSTIGTTSSAQLGVLISLLFFSNANNNTRMIFAFIISLAFTLIFIITTLKIKVKNQIFIPLIGIMFGGIIESITFFIAYTTDTVQTLSSISIGSFTTMVEGRFEILFILIIPVVLALFYTTAFNIISMGEDFSKNLGVNYKLTIFLGVISVAIISSVCYVVVGPIPFLGLIVPNIIAIYFGENLKKTVFDLMAFGAVLLLFADILARVIVFPYQIPTGVVLGVLGALVFLILIFKRLKK